MEAKRDTEGSEAGEPHQFGPYQLHELINTGGMAEIWIASNAKSETVAIRKLHNKSRFNFLEKKRFLQGCEVLAHIHNHQNVIGYISHGKISGQPYLEMEYLESSNLKLLFARSDPLLEENIGNILIDMAVGLEHVHDSGYIHRDFKPENIIISRNASLRLIDFDLAIPKPEKPVKMKHNPGTPAYMAPEQLLRQPLDHRVDMFAYGVAAFELLTNQKPFPGDSPGEILKLQLDRSEFVTPRELNPDIPANLEKTILKCLDTDMQERYPHMSVLARDLQAALYV